MDSDPHTSEPANLKFLRRLVTTLTATMIIGLVVLIGLIVIRLQNPDLQNAELVLPDTITVPDGVSVLSFTQADDWYAVVTTDDQILIFDRTSGDLRQTVKVK